MHALCTFNRNMHNINERKPYYKEMFAISSMHAKRTSVKTVIRS
jgi:hypothetical protein